MALEKSGRLLDRVAAVFFNLAGAHTNEALQAIEREMAPQARRARDAPSCSTASCSPASTISTSAATALELTDEQRRVLELRHTWLVRAGARLGRKDKARVAEINAAARDARHAVHAERAEGRAVLAPGARRRARPRRPAGRRCAPPRRARPPTSGLEGKHVITLPRSSVEPFLQFSARRDLREQAFNAWIRRGEMGGETDNRAIVAEIVALRAELARPAGLQDASPITASRTRWRRRPTRVRELLHRGVAGGREARRRASATALQQRARAEGGNFEIAPWDWRYYAEKERKARYDVDEAATRPYLELDNVIAAAFDTRHAAVRPAVQGAPRRAALSPRRAGLGGARQARRARRPVPRRLFRAALEALGRLDVGLPLAAQGRRAR